MRTIDKINYYLTKENKNGADLCEYLGVSSGVYSQWNTGRTHPRKSKLPIIAEYLGVEVSDIQGNAAVIRDYGKTPAAIRQVPLLSMLKEALQPIRKMPKDTYIIGLDTKPVSKSRYDRMWQKFWRKYGVAKPVPRTKSVVKHGKNVTVAYTDWKVPVCGHQFRHEYVCMLAMAGVPEEIAIQLVGHANAKMIHEVYLALKPQMIEEARKKLEAVLSNVN